ncbi:unnamed protein product [Rhodiola kirilowii]
MGSTYVGFQVICSAERPRRNSDEFLKRSSASSSFKALKWKLLLAREIKKLAVQVDASKEMIKRFPRRMLDSYFDLVFQFVDQPLPPLQVSDAFFF